MNGRLPPQPEVLGTPASMPEPSGMTRRDFVRSLSAAGVAVPGVVIGQNTQWQVRRIGSTAERLAAKPYPRRFFRSENYPSCLVPDYPHTGVTVEEYVQLIHEGGIEVQIVAADWNYGTPRFPSTRLPAHPDVYRDRLPHFLQLAHERGILVLTYYPIIYNKPLKKVHPEWLMQFLDDGRPEPENLGWFCLNSPFRDWLPEHLHDFLEYLDLDGFYFDDTNWGSHVSRPWHPSCCCGHCEKLFRRETGLALPRKVDFASTDFRRLVLWRYEKLRDAFHHIARRVREKYPDAVLDFHYYGRPTTDWSDGHPLNPLRLGEVQAHFFIETHRTVRESGFVAKLARAHGSPTAIWRNSVQSIPECTGSLAPYAEPFAPALHGLVALAHGIRPQYGIFDHTITLNRRVMGFISTELRRRAEYSEGEPVKYLALHCSQQQRDFWRPPKSVPPFREVRLKSVLGAYEMLNRSHLLVDIVFDEQLTYENLSRYRVLFLSNSACLSDRQCDEIRRFVRAGGTLIATHETSLMDELGRPRSDYQLADVFGVSHVGGRASGGLHGIVWLPRTSDLASLFGQAVCMAGEDSDVVLRSGDQVELICTRGGKTRERPLDSLGLKGPDNTGKPAVTRHVFGKGQAYYLGADVGSGYLENPYPPLKRLVAHLVRQTPSPIDIHAPGAIEVTALRRPGEIVIHLVNNPTPLTPLSMSQEDQSAFFYLEEVPPVFDLTVRVNGFGVRRVYLPLQGTVLARDAKDFRVSRVDLHEIVVLNLEA